MGLGTRLRLARLYLCTDAREAHGDLGDFLTAAFAGGVDIVQIRQKNMDRDAELAALEVAQAAAQPYQGLVCVNDSARLAERFGADLLHLGQDDGSARRARKRLHEWALVGRSTHNRRQAEAAVADEAVSYFCVGPVYATATKPDYAPVGLDLVRQAAEVAPVTDVAAKPWFAIGGIDATTLEDVLVAGARRVVVARAITEASDPQAAAARLSQRLAEAWRADPGMERYRMAAFGAGSSHRTS
jgi:thiamine-phosphate pyrophosphorylase